MKSYQINNIKIGEGSPKVIIPLMGGSEEELMKEVYAVKELSPDIVEWRADVFGPVDDMEAVQRMAEKINTALMDIPLLFTFRSHKEGGNKEISSDYYSKLIAGVIKTRYIDLVDIELFFNEEDLDYLVGLANKNNVFVVMSNHDFEKTPAKEEIISRLKLMQKYGAHIPKIAVMPKNTEDVLTLLEATTIMREKYADRPIITMAMGKLGVVSRLTGEIFGSAATFGAGKSSSAPGQIDTNDLRTVLEVLHKNL